MGSVSDCYTLHSRTADGLLISFNSLFSLAAIYDRNKDKAIADRIGTEVHRSMDSDLEIENIDEILNLEK